MILNYFFADFGHTIAILGRSDNIMMYETGFWKGMGIGLIAGSALGMTLSCERNAMKTQTGKRIQQMGSAVDQKLDNLRKKIR